MVRRQASRYKSYSQYLSFVVIASGALIPFIQIFEVFSEPARFVVTIATAALGVVVVVAEGAERIGRFEETWLSYRKAAERMKREYRVYVTGAGVYRQASDEQDAYLRFFENVEEIIAEEQQLYWQGRAGEGRTRNGDEAKRAT
ncbi:MAG TPA: DUF4231 domain-containing protein [Geminicoccaceae bacterium]|nr:DUF4231 domain-containing protein [Geminicoccaceae bacterium]